MAIYLYILFMDIHAHAEQHQELPLAEASLSSHNCVLCLPPAGCSHKFALHLTSLTPEGSEDPHLWQNACINKTNLSI